MSYPTSPPPFLLRSIQLPFENEFRGSPDPGLAETNTSFMERELGKLQQALPSTETNSRTDSFEKARTFCSNASDSVVPDQGLVVHDYIFGSDDDKDNDSASSIIMTYLGSGHPVAIGIRKVCGILKNCSAKQQKEDESHEILIVGRRWDQKTNSCEVEVKNSWGRWDAYCRNAAAGTECHNGYYWIPLKAVSSALFTLDALVPRSSP
jgi:hypothetical protein